MQRSTSWAISPRCASPARRTAHRDDADGFSGWSSRCASGAGSSSSLSREREYAARAAPRAESSAAGPAGGGERRSSRQSRLRRRASGRGRPRAAGRRPEGRPGKREERRSAAGVGSGRRSRSVAIVGGGCGVRDGERIVSWWGLVPGAEVEEGGWLSMGWELCSIDHACGGVSVPWRMWMMFSRPSGREGESCEVAGSELGILELELPRHSKPNYSDSSTLEENHGESHDK